MTERTDTAAGSSPRAVGDGEAQAGLGTHELDLLENALADIHATARSNDAKNPPALIVHGLLFAGTTSVVARIGPIWPDVPVAARIVVVSTLALALGAMLVSVLCLLVAIRPRTRHQVASELAGSYREVMFPAPAALAREARDTLGSDDARRQVEVLRRRAAGAGAGDARDAYVAEIVKLSHLHAHKAQWTRTGINALIIEIASVVTALATIGVVALAS